MNYDGPAEAADLIAQEQVYVNQADVVENRGRVRDARFNKNRKNKNRNNNNRKNNNWKSNADWGYGWNDWGDGWMDDDWNGNGWNGSNNSGSKGGKASGSGRWGGKGGKSSRGGSWGNDWAQGGKAGKGSSGGSWGDDWVDWYDDWAVDDWNYPWLPLDDWNRGSDWWTAPPTLSPTEAPTLYPTLYPTLSPTEVVSRIPKYSTTCAKTLQFLTIIVFANSCSSCLFAKANTITDSLSDVCADSKPYQM